MFQPTDTITRILKQHPAAARVFERYGMDYCCAGGTTLAAACSERGADTADLIRDLEELLTPAGQDHDVSPLSPAEFVDHMTSTHHVYLREELPRLDAMTTRVAMVHLERNPRLQEIRDTWHNVGSLMTAHLEKDERILFPLVREFAGPSGSSIDPVNTASLAVPVAQLDKDHEQLQEGIGRLRELTEDYAAPPWACGTYRAMLEALARFESDTSQHLRKEKTWLIPRAMSRA